MFCVVAILTSMIHVLISMQGSYCCNLATFVYVTVYVAVDILFTCKHIIMSVCLSALSLSVSDILHVHCVCVCIPEAKVGCC